MKSKLIIQHIVQALRIFKKQIPNKHISNLEFKMTEYNTLYAINKTDKSIKFIYPYVVVGTQEELERLLNA